MLYPSLSHGGHSSVNDVATNQQCPKCRGNGWVHESTMQHNTGAAQKCFFCKDCKGCGAKGYVQGMQKVITTTNAFGHTSTQSFGHSMSTCPKCRGNGWVHEGAM